MPGAWLGPVLGNVGAATVTHDTKGNITAVGSDSYGYSSENFLTSGPGSATLGYDPMGRLYQVAQGAGTTRMGYDGLDRIVEYDGSNAIQRRYIHGPGVDEPITWYEGSGITTRRFLSSDERGSIISVTDGAGTVLGLNKYDEYGVPQATNLGKFGYTGQAWVPEVGLWYYKARFYGPKEGRFYQTDLIPTPNLYAYVTNDPLNLADPLGLNESIVVVGVRKKCEGICFEGALSDIAFAGPSLIWGPHFEDIGGFDGILHKAGQKDEQAEPDCDSELPSGETIGEVVRTAIEDTLTAPPDVNSNTELAASIASKMAFYTFPKGPLDFKNSYKGEADPAWLAAAGNFAYGAYVSALGGPGVSNFGAKLYGVVSSLLGLKSQQFMAPNGMSKSGAANVPRGNENAGCPR